MNNAAPSSHEGVFLHLVCIPLSQLFFRYSSDIPPPSLPLSLFLTHPLISNTPIHSTLYHVSLPKKTKKNFKSPACCLTMPCGLPLTFSPLLLTAPTDPFLSSYVCLDIAHTLLSELLLSYKCGCSGGVGFS